MKISVVEEEPELHYPLVGDREEDERRGFLDAVVGEHERSDPVNLITKPIAAIALDAVAVTYRATEAPTTLPCRSSATTFAAGGSYESCTLPNDRSPRRRWT
jgi:hypothetical protein